MAFRVGQRVQVRELPEGHPLRGRSGRKGEVDRVEGDRVLVDDQLVNGVRVGYLTMRDWFHEDDLDHG